MISLHIRNRKKNRCIMPQKWIQTVFVIICMCLIQACILYIWKKETLFYEKRMKNNLIAIASFLVSALTGGFLYYTNIDLLNVCKMLLVYAITLTVTLYDWQEHRIPNKVLGAGVMIRLILLAGEYGYHREQMKMILVSCLAGTAVVLLLLMLVTVLTKQGFGMGDVKLFAFICFTLGLAPTYNIFFYSILYTAVISIFLLITKKADKKFRMPFAPFILLGYLTVVFFQMY